MGHKRMLQLPEGVNTFRSKPGVPRLSSFSKHSREVDAQEGVGCSLDCYESLIALEMIDWVGETVIGLHMRHLELSRNWFAQNKSGERLGGMKIEII